jgi:FolB domain-containing protein
MIRQVKNCLRIVDLEVRCIVGILAHERVTEQRLLLNIELDVDFECAQAEGTQMTHGVDYGAVAQYCRDTVILKKYGLLEDLLKDLSYNIFEKFPPCLGLILRATKPDILPYCRGVEAEIQLSRRPLES